MYFLYNFRKYKIIKKNAIIIFILFVLLNPITLAIAGSFNEVYRYNIYNYHKYKDLEPCGIKVVDFKQGSPLELDGMQKGEIIIRINGTKVVTTEEWTDFIETINAADELRVITLYHRYFVNPVYYEEYNGYGLGIIMTQNYCKKSE